MSDKELASRADVQVVFGGVDITAQAKQDLISFSYTDNEEDEADDFQLKVHDRDGKWLRIWLDPMVDNAAQGGDVISTAPESESTSVGTSSTGASAGTNAYKVTSSNGVNVRASADESGKLLGKLLYGTIVEVYSFSNGWAKIKYQGKTAYIKGKNLKSVGSGSSSSSGSSTTQSSAYSERSTQEVSSDWAIGDGVIVTGNPQYDSWGFGKPGKYVENHQGKITYLNLKSGIPYPIHVDYLGWFVEKQVSKYSGNDNSSSGATVSGSKGLQISAVICQQNRNGDGKDVLLDCGTFELDSIDASGPPSVISIKGTSLAYANTIRQTIKSRSWESTTLKDIATVITESNGMGLMFESSANPKYTRVEQYQMSDIAFLQQLCHNAGCSLKATNNILVIFDQSEYEQKETVCTIEYGAKGGYSSYKLATEENGNYLSCRVYYTTQSGKVISATEYAANYDGNDNKGQHLDVRQKVSSVAEAQSLAHKILRLHNKYEYTASFTFPGNPTLVAGVTMELKDFGLWDGKYIVKQAQHDISSSGYTTKIKLRKIVAEAMQSNDSSSEATSDEELQDIALQVIRGNWGNGAERKKRLTEAGYDYAAVQAQVNKILYG